MYPFVFFLSLFLAPRLGTAVLHGPCASAVLARHPQLHQRQALGLASPGAGLPRMSMDVWWLKLQMSILGSVHLEGRHSRTTGPPQSSIQQYTMILVAASGAISLHLWLFWWRRSNLTMDTGWIWWWTVCAVCTVCAQSSHVPYPHL